ncbi:MAG: cupin domain-containing protein [Bacteroidetes bacterium]|nr:MAG: cupin domain-containing protein [Bacteroidota bacterium]
MKRLTAILLMTFSMVVATAQTLKDRIVRNDPSKYRNLTAVHAGAGQMAFTQLIGRTELSTNFLYLHAGVINAKSGIGHHFHHTIEEMYVLLTGEAEFTINGRTSKIKAPAIVPCKMGDAHAIYNSSKEPVRWLNFAVSETKGRADNFDLGDTRVGAAIDLIPVFVSGRLEQNKLKPVKLSTAGNSVLYRRVFGPDIFRTDWNHVDHLVIAPDSTSGPRQLEGIEEVYYVIKGSGTVSINNEIAAVKADDAFYGKLGEKITLAADSKEGLELLVIGINASKEKGLNISKPLLKPKAIVLQMDFIVPKENAESFEKMYYSIYVPAMTVQQGYLSSKLLRLFPEDIAKSIQAEPTTYNYQIQISFDTEENRKKWVASEQHKIAWPSASGLAKEFKWRGYDVMGDDDQR